MVADGKSIAAERKSIAVQTKSIAVYKRAVVAHKSSIADCKEIGGCLQEVYSGRCNIYGGLRSAEADRTTLLADQVIRKPNHLLLD